MHPVYAHLQVTLLGRLQTRLLSEISGSLDELPSEREIVRTFMEKWKHNSNDGRFFFNLIYCQRTHRLEVPARFPAKQVRAVLAELGERDVIRRLFSEGRWYGVGGTPQHGCLIFEPSSVLRAGLGRRQ
jgi:hypothetical protein